MNVYNETKMCERNIYIVWLGANPGHLREQYKCPVVDSVAFYPNVSFNLTKASVLLLCPTINYIKLDKTTSLHIKFI
jgi:hypothetical protein